MANSSLKIKIN